MNRPLISVILPVYNIEEYLPKCMDSLFAQTYSNLEFIIIDDGSRPKCSELCDKMAQRDSRVVVYHKPNGGLSDARNYGILKANGEYITCVDPDDYVDVDYVEYLFNLVDRFHTKMSVCQHRVIFPQKVKEYGSGKDSEMLTAEKCIERMLYHDVIDTSAWAKLYHKSLFYNVSYPTGKIFEDIATTYKLMINSKEVGVGYQSKYNYCYRDNSIVNDNFSMKKLELIEMTDSMAEEVNSIYPELIKATLRRKVYARFSTLNQMIGAKGVDDIRRQIIDYILCNYKPVINDPKTPKRDKYALILLKIGYPLYERVWKLYKARLYRYS